VAYYPCCTWPHQVLNRTFCYPSLVVLDHIRLWIEPFAIRVVEEVQLPLSLKLLGDPIQSIPWLWNQPIQVGKQHGLSLVTKTKYLLWPLLDMYYTTVWYNLHTYSKSHNESLSPPVCTGTDRDQQSHHIFPVPRKQHLDRKYNTIAHKLVTIFTS
jgi:hypothetical protein